MMRAQHLAININGKPATVTHSSSYLAFCFYLELRHPRKLSDDVWILRSESKNIIKTLLQYNSVILLNYIPSPKTP